MHQQMNIQHQPFPNLPHDKWSCAAFALCVLLNVPVQRINQKLRAMRRREKVSRANEPWTNEYINNNMHWMYDYEIQRFMRPFTRKTKCIFPQRSITVHQLAARFKPEEVVVVMIHQHLMVIHQNRIWDTVGCNRSTNGWWGDCKVIWYQRCKA